MAATLILGTAQLGNSYGINNAEGELAEGQAFGILYKAFEEGVRILDTAEGYGKSGKVIGNFLRDNPCEDFEVCTKLSSIEASSSFQAISDLVSGKIQAFIESTAGKTPWIYYLHDFDMCKNELIIEALIEQKKQGSIQRIGVSIYEPEEFEFVLGLNNEQKIIDAIQIPLNLFNCAQWLSSNLIKTAVDSGLLVLARSVFLQGLVFKSPDDPFVKQLGLEDPLSEFGALAKETGYSKAQLACDFVRACEGVSYILLGCETVDQVVDDAQLFESAPVWNKEMIARQIQISAGIQPEKIDPRKWQAEIAREKSFEED